MPQIYPNNNSQKRGNARLPKLFVVELQVGDKVYSAEGRTRQQAKHEAAVQGKTQTLFFARADSEYRIIGF